MRTFNEIIEILKNHKAELREKYKVKDIGVFGSCVRDEQKKRSDVDILVEFDEDDIPGLLEFIALERYLKRLLKKKVDLVRKGGIRPELKDIVLKEVIFE